MCHDKTKKVGRNPGLRPKWRGPYIIMNKINPANMVIQMSAGDKEVTVHVDRLKHCFPARKRSFRWAKKQIGKTQPDIKLDWGETDTDGSDLGTAGSGDQSNETDGFIGILAPRRLSRTYRRGLGSLPYTRQELLVKTVIRKGDQLWICPG